MSRPGLAVVIPCYRGAARVGETLRCLAAAAPGVPVVLVDDGSDDDTAGAAGRAAAGLDLRIERHAANRGRAAACNTGLRAAAAEWAWILDDDMRVDARAVTALRSRLDGGDDGQPAILGRIRLPEDLPRSPFTAFLRHEEADRHRKLLESHERVHWRHCLTGNFCARRDVLLRLGGFDERITVYGFEDIELGIRLCRAGFRLVYAPEVAAVHRAYAVDLGRLRQRTYLSGRVAPQVARSHADDPEVRAFLRLDGMGRVQWRRDRPFLAAMKLLNRLLQRPAAAAWLASPAGERAVLGAVAALERLPLRRLRHLSYHFARDVSYYRGIADASAAGGGSR